MTVIIGLAGRAGSGKDTAAAGLVRDEGFVRIGLADAVKEAVTVLNPAGDTGIPVSMMLRIADWKGPMSDESFLPAWDVVKKDPEARRLLQVMGTEVARDMFGDDVWLKRMLVKAAEHERVVVPDVRFTNEAQAILDAGGTVVTIVRPGVVGIRQHVSETPLPVEVAPWQLVNDGTIEQLQEQVRERVMPFVLYPPRWITGISEVTTTFDEAAYFEKTGRLFTSGCRPVLCPDCKTGKHENCAGSWCLEHDHAVPCPCEHISH